MGERKGVNKYYPPDWDPSKGSINEYVGQHPLRDRARKLGQGILVIRFEMPYNIWCGGCNNHIGMGVRYNAEKSKTGMYYTTPIYKFRMKCHLCDNYFEIQTDPKNHDYVILEGARRKEQRWDPKENEQIVPEDKATQKKMATDAMFKLEHGSDDIQKSKKAVASLTSLEVRRDEWKDDYLLNKMARQKFRDEKKAIKAESDSDSALLLKSSLDIPLQKETEEDIRLAGLIKYRALQSYEERQAEKRREIESRPLFEPASKVSRTEKLSPENKKLVVIKRTLQIARNSSQTSPFDRTKADTLGIGGTTVNTQSLGIRRKSVQKLPCMSITSSENVEESSENVEESSENVEESSENVEESSESDKDSCFPTNNPLNLREENFLASNNSGTSCNCSKLPECGNCIHETVSHTASDCSSNNFMDKQVSNEADEISELENIKDLGKDETLQDSVISDSEKQSANNNTDVSTTGLRLVCSYSDTDSDS